jgi:CRISPR/Cas system Type II protein with McrA/HNH and RuvC-like nuclease domain
MTREEIFARDEYRCVYCGGIHDVEELSVDHVQPRSRGGDRSRGNLVTACRACNVRKGRRRLATFFAEDQQAYNNFRRLAIHVWKRHLRVLEADLRRADCRAPRRSSARTKPSIKRNRGVELRVSSTT